MNKSELRTLLTQRLASLEKAEIASASQAVAERLKDSIEWGAVRSLHVYAPVMKWREVDISKFTSWLKDIVRDIEVEVASAESTAFMPSETFDVILVPLLGFDEKCQRLGRGTGWYDRFLAQQPKATKIGVAFDRQRVDFIPAEAHDEALDIIVTESATYSRSVRYN